MSFGFYFSFLTFVFSLRLTISFFDPRLVCLGCFKKNLWLNDQFLNTSQYGKTYCPSLATAGICLDALSFCSDGNRLGLFSTPGTASSGVLSLLFLWDWLTLLFHTHFHLSFLFPFPLSCFSSLALLFLPRGSSVV